ncbi:MAG: hypothetical protein JXB18_06305 [Sedimentisphaerales bacterium]|nr:hypothetical protein [Sedimentisphaerales bacterium]
MQGVEPVLYRLPELLAADPSSIVFIPEGEKDVENLVSLGLVATCNLGGAGKWRASYSDVLSGRHVVILPDNDDPGRKHAEQVARSLSGKAKEIKILILDGLPPKGDVSDWLAAGHNKEELMRLVEQAVPYQPSITSHIETEAAIASDSLLQYPLTDAGVGEMFADTCGGRFRFCHSWGRWLVYDGKRWDTARGEPEARRAMVQMARRLRDIALSLPDNQRATVEKFARQLESSGRIDSGLREARCVPPVSCTIEDFNRNPWLLNTQNGTIDLTAGTRANHRPEDMMTQITQAEFDAEAGCPRFAKFLYEIMCGNEALVMYLIRWLGHCLTGDIREQILPIFYGDGSNGKSVLLDTVRALLGDYATEAAPDLLIAKNGNEHPCEVADLFGKRLVVASESEQGASFKLQLVKRITGDSILKARFMRQDYFTFTRTSKVILVTNNRPIVKEDTSAIWRRLKLIPFAAKFTSQSRDDTLRLKLETEWPGILNLLIQGCLKWQKHGLCEPEEIENATGEYRQSQDPLADFLAECCELKPGAVTPISLLSDRFETWTQSVGRDSENVTPRAFNQSLRQRGCKYETQYFDGKTQKVWVGVDVIR